MPKTKGKTTRKRGKKIDAAKVRVRDLAPKRGKVVGGGVMGGSGGFAALPQR